jgi:hypothetical protein
LRCWGCGLRAADLLKLAGTEDEIPRGDLVPESLADLMSARSNAAQKNREIQHRANIVTNVTA